MSHPLRILLYSHDTFGLGHLRRNGKIANALAVAFPDARIVIVSGSQKAGSFDLRPEVDFVRLPSVYKSTDGDYYSGEHGLSRQAVLDMRSRTIVETASWLRPHLFVADKEPLGLLGELEDALTVMKEMGTQLVLGLREVLDEPDVLRSEWERKHITEQVLDLYDRFWVYGPRGFYDPLDALDLSADVKAKTHFLGFIETKPEESAFHPQLFGLPDDYILVTAGGGGDGWDMMTSLLTAYEFDRSIALPPVLLLGPFMEPSKTAYIHSRAQAIPGSVVLEFEREPERLMAGASGVVAMCGYNTFCEVMSFDKPGLFIPREKPRLEQFIRASRASELGLCRMMRTHDAADDPGALAAALKILPDGPRRSTAASPLNMDGLTELCDAVSADVGFKSNVLRFSHG